MVKVLLKRFGIFKMAFFMGLYGFFIGLILGLIIAVISLFASTSTIQSGLLVTGWLNIIVLPVFFGAFNFFVSLILTPLVNLILKILKGIELDFLEVEEPNEIPQKNSPVKQQKPIVSKSKY